jgi:hypothetical protein
MMNQRRRREKVTWWENIYRAGGGRDMKKMTEERLS